MADGNLGDVRVKFTADTKDVDKGLQGMTGATQNAAGKLSSAFSGVGLAIGAAFSVQAIGAFIGESVKLAGEVQGVEQAFNRINGANINDLRRSVRGTVSDLELMKSAVQANNFKIPVEQLGKLFEFAQKRATQTGESVDYLTRSIVLGIGRKSPLILDNLGISAIELRDRLKGVGVEAASVADVAKIVGKIADEELSKMGDVALTTADRMQQITAETENLKVEIGNRLTPAMNVFYSKVLDVVKALSEMTMLLGKPLDIKQFDVAVDLLTNNGEEMNRVTEWLEKGMGRATTMAERGKIMLYGFSDAQIKIAETARLAAIELNKAYNKRRKPIGPFVSDAEKQKAELDSLRFSLFGINGLLTITNELTDDQTTGLEKAAKALAKYEEMIVGASQALKDLRAEELHEFIIGGGGGGFGNLEKTRGIDIPDPMDGLEVESIDEIDPAFNAFLQDATDNLNAMAEAQEWNAWAMEMASGFATDFSNALAQSIVNGENLGEAMGEVFKNLLIQLIQVVAQALILTAIMAAITGGGSLASGGFASLFKQNLLGGGGGFQLGGFVRGEDIYLSSQRGNTNRGR